MYDKIEKIGKSQIQHGELNDRIYLQKLSKSDFPQIILELDRLAKKNSYSKIFAKIPNWALDEFTKNGFIEEAAIPKFYNNKIKALFVAKYLDSERETLSNERKNKIKKIIELATDKESVKTDSINVDEKFTTRILKKSDIDKLVDLYKNVFESYPFPIFESDYIEQTMESYIKYFGIFYDDELVSASSSELDLNSQNCEMTDFATNPKFRGNGLATLLLSKMEEEVKKLSVKTLYTIARSQSPGMNITFSKLGYNFSGTLIKNTNISGRIESMNVWYKHI
ncbi:MAG: putative beta-lysine N-acetyltransferase [Ignavibacteriales bacterium]|nr:putative beta-lysine N-acetyltransferase [Ignavibacteriales bacterium]MCB9219203.1 putative beta-lysine N-acetyltransferase [Ignavibacteriales bacterium]MCB9259785.1 putative beta-lysine N-acetyltransferase [Ignavibacteriales bacterium]